MGRSSVINEIRSALLDAGGLSGINDDVVSKCAALVSTHDVTPNQLAECWVALSLNKGIDNLDVHSFESLRVQIIKQYELKQSILNGGMDTDSLAVITRNVKRQSSSMTHDVHNQKSVNVTPPSKKSMSEKSDPIPFPTNHANPSSRRISMSPGIPSSLRKADANSNALSTMYANRTDKGKILCSHVPNNLSDYVPTGWNNTKCSIRYDLYDTNIKDSYRHMFTTLEERSAALQNHLTEVGDIMIETYNLGKMNEVDQSDNEIACLEEVGVPLQDRVCCLGRVCNAAHEGKLNQTSVVIEGSRVSGGARVELDLSVGNLSYSLFPGQIIAVEGFNTSGNKMIAQRICEGAAHVPNKACVKELMKYHHDDRNQGNQPLKIVTAAGPYTTNDNLDFLPLFDLVQDIIKCKPDVVILNGPFVDMRHELVSSGETTLCYEDGSVVTVPFDTFFANKVSALIEELYDENEECKTQFVLVPSLYDATAEWVFPQPPFANNTETINLSIPGSEGIKTGSLGLEDIEVAGNGVSPRNGSFKRVHCVPNPCTIKVNETVIGITSNDVLFDMSSDTTSANLESGTRLARISQSILQQRSYYPLFPASIDTNLKKMDQWKIPCALDILLLPSKLAPFSRVVLDHTLVVNPGFLCRGTGGGSYAVMDIHPMKREILENAGGDDVEILHNIPERTVVNVKRI